MFSFRKSATSLDVALRVTLNLITPREGDAPFYALCMVAPTAMLIETSAVGKWPERTKMTHPDG